MSNHSSPNLVNLDHDNSRSKRRDKPPALHFPDTEKLSDTLYHFGLDSLPKQEQPRLHVSHVEDNPTESDYEVPRSTSATSSLDPYYFGVSTPPESPSQIQPSASASLLPKTPDNVPATDPVTPGKDPASIDRRGLVGVGELATPRWTRSDRHREIDIDEQLDEVDETEPIPIVQQGDYENDMPDSPWTIEAIDGEQDDEIEVWHHLQSFNDLPLTLSPKQLDPYHITRPLRSRRSIADESGGEEILYPRHPLPVDHSFPMPHIGAAHLATYPISASNSSDGGTGAASPPSAYIPQAHRARKRTSEEFELDHSGTLVSKHASAIIPATSPKDKDKASVRRHRSLGASAAVTRPQERVKEKRRDTLSVNVKHARQASASSSSSSHGENLHSRRIHASDFSHLPPSPSTSSIQQFLKHVSTGSTAAPSTHASHRDSHQHQTPNMAHSLLRGTQEGWSDLDDTATAEALRKLDGLSGRSARARSSVGSHVRVASTSRPTTPVKTDEQPAPTTETRRSSRRFSTFGSLSKRDGEKAKDHGVLHSPPTVGLGLSLVDPPPSKEEAGASSGDAASGSPSEKANKKAARSSFTPKRGSASSTNYTSTPTTSSRDSASLSTATSATSVSAISSRQSTAKARRNSAGSDISSFSQDAALRDRTGSLSATGDVPEDANVPPVPPLPKDISSYKPGSQPIINSTYVGESSDEKHKARRSEIPAGRGASLEVPNFPTTPSKHHSFSLSKAPTTPTTHKTPSKKWSFTNALGKKLSKSPSSSSINDSSSSKSPNTIISPRSLTFGQQLRKSTSKDHPSATPKQSIEEWHPVNAEAMVSASSLVSQLSMNSTQATVAAPTSAPHPITTSKTPDRLVPSRSGTASSASTNLTASVPPLPHNAPLSPASSVRRGPSTKRLTPSSIPFFRRSSSQSMQFPPSGVVPSSSPTQSTSTAGGSHLRAPSNFSPTKEANHPLPSVPGSAHKKSSVLSLGLPSLLKGSSSRRSLHSDKEKSDAKSSKDSSRGKDSDKEKPKKEEKERSESRISVLMGRKRGKTLSSAQPKRAEPVALPPMQISALPPATAQRLANLKSSSSSSSSVSTPQSVTKTGSRATSQTMSSMQKHSDSSLRSRNQLPTIAGSPSVGSLAHQPTKEAKEAPPLSALNISSSLTKETPTKIPRISSRSSAANSPTLKSNGRRASAIVGTGINVQQPPSSSRGASPTNTAGTITGTGSDTIDEFGVLENNMQTPKTAHRQSVRTSPSATTSRVPRQVSAPASSSATNGTHRKSNRDSISFTGLRKSSTGSVSSIQATVSQESQPPPTQSHHRFSALSPSKGLKLLTPKMSLPTARLSSSTSQSISQAIASPSSSRQSLSTPSPAPSSVDEEELAGDEEMMQYIKRQHAKKLASGISQAELDAMLRFPEPKPPVTPSLPAAILKSSQSQYLSEYECKEILDFQSVYYIGASSNKNLATLDNSTNNYGYDDERGDYLVVNRDHLAYRYEVKDTLGKGSFGQVLHCRDHCTGESVAIKIIRNKKRFHHQALVEIKILDSLRKWDHDEKHHVIKMTEHFYFRGHLCIAMELLSINLYELIKANGFVGFTTALIRRFTSQMLQSLALMRHHRIVHCDLKPENVLLRHPAKSAIKVIDFGSSCFEHEKIYTYIQSRFYRSPEVILGMNYHMAIDMWSLGCILAELYTGFPIFPGENEQEQLACIMEVLGIPDKDFINRSSRKRLFFDTTGAPRPVVNSKGRRRRPGTKTLSQVLRCDDELFLDFISKCLVWDPERRLKPQAALRHPFITANRRTKITPSPSAAKALLSSSSFSSRSKQVMETPKKSQISAPTPLTARSARVAAGVVPSTPSNSSTVHATLGGSARSYRASQSQSMSYHSSRTMVRLQTLLFKSGRSTETDTAA